MSGAEFEPVRVADGAAFWSAGIDGCPAGWLVVLLSWPDGAISCERVVAEQARVAILPDITDILGASEQPAIIAVDMPIGLAERTGVGGRPCDVAARVGLGQRQSAVFAVPARAAVMAEDYANACAQARARSEPPRAVSKQCFNLFPKVRQLDRLMTPALQARLVECHPEVAFVAMNAGRPLELAKKVKSRPHAPGLQLRRELLAAGGVPVKAVEAGAAGLRGCGSDDVLDACACAWTAGRIARGQARRMPAEPERDAHGLRMEIWG